MSHIVRVSINIGGSRLPDDQFSKVYIEQRVGRHHDFVIRLRQDANQGVIDDRAKAWIGKPINIGFDYQADEQLMLSPLADSFKGIITSVGLSRQSGTAELIIQGHSPTIYTEDGPNTRSFTDMSQQEIASKVLKNYNFPSAPTIAPKSYSKSLPYTVQYKESNFAFVARLASRYGEWFYFDGLDLYYGKPDGGDTVVLDFGENGLSYFDMSVRAIPTKQKLWGYDYVKHEELTEETKLKSKTSALGKDIMNIATGQVFNQTPSMAVTPALDRAELENLTKRREQVAVDEIVMMHGSTRNPKLKVGATIEVKDTEIGENYGKFTITSLTHDIGQGGDYVNHFEAIPKEVETPPLTSMPEPPFCETQLAKVTKVDDDKKLGRVKVKFQWQDGSPEETPWIRVASPYTGKDKGFYIIPEVDDQVLVAFENNHPDRPYVLTGMYNGEAKPEWFDAKNKYKGFKSKGGNKWKFNDEAKSIQIHAPSSILMSAGSTISLRTGKKDDDGSIVMKEGKEITVKSNGKADSIVKVDVGLGTIHLIAKTITIEASELVDVKSQKEVKIDGMTEVKVNGTQKVEVTGTEIKVEAKAKLETSGAQVSIKGTALVEVKALAIKLN